MSKPHDGSSSKPWYADGLRFECTQCGRCCGGSPGFVWLTDEEAEKIARRLGIENTDRFLDLYTRKIGARRSLKEFPNGDCVFLDEETRGCTIYEHRPLQCKTWPFWDSNLKSPQDWNETANECPGCNQGPLYSLEVIDAQRSQLRI